MPKFRDIPKFTRAHYAVDVSWRFLEEHIASQSKLGLDLEPDFQRAHVWTREQQIAYVEYILRGGESACDIYFNCVGWNHINSNLGPYVIVDGKQRLAAARAFVNNQIPAFGSYISEYEDKLDWVDYRFRWHVASLETRAEVLQWYIDFNTGGTIHTSQEIERVRALLAEEKGDPGIYHNYIKARSEN